MRLKLVRLSIEYKTQLEDMLSEWIEYNNTHKTNHSPWAIFKNDYHNFEYYLENLDFKETLTHVATSTFFCLDEERNIFVGAVNIRHTLNEGLLIDGGHIGDGVRPSERRKGIATKMVALALLECKKLGLKRVLMVCDKDNIGSRKSITNNGGVLESEIVEEDGNVEQRYWIELSSYNKIEGDHIVLRKAKLGDDKCMLKNVWGAEGIYKTMWFTPSNTEEDAKSRLIRTINFQSYTDMYFVALKDTDEPIGLCGLKEEEPGIYEECGICIAEKYQGLGYGSELLAIILDLAFNKYNAKSFRYVLMKNNYKSKRLLNKYEFKLDHVTKETRTWDEQEFELEYYKLDKENFK